MGEWFWVDCTEKKKMFIEFKYFILLPCCFLWNHAWINYLQLTFKVFKTSFYLFYFLWVVEAMFFFGWMEILNFIFKVSCIKIMSYMVVKMLRSALKFFFDQSLVFILNCWLRQPRTSSNRPVVFKSYLKYCKV